jgi:hypothetical protein
LGWSINPGVSQELRGVIYTANSSGVRSLKEYDPLPPPGIIRLAAFGPSFTHGDEVGDDQTWEAQLEQARPELEVMNWGVGGYGTDQAYLRYKTEGAAYQPHIVIIGFEEENTSRNVNRFRSFYRPGTEFPLTKPVFITDTNGLILLENPFTSYDDLYQALFYEPNRFIETVCPHDIFCDEAVYQAHPLDVLAGYRFFRTLAYEIDLRQKAGVSEKHFRQSYEAEITLGVIRLFVEDVIRNGALPIVLVFPEQATLSEYDSGNLPAYHLGVVTLRDRGVPVIDLAGAFAEAKRTQGLEYQDFYASEGGHYNALGNQVVAQTVMWHLCGEGLLSDC